LAQAEIAQDPRLVGRDLKGRRIEALRLVVTPELIEGRALSRQNAPVRPLAVVGLFERPHGLLEAARPGQRLAVGGHDAFVVRMAHGGLLEHGDGRGVLPEGAQRRRVIERRGAVVLVARRALAPLLRGFAQRSLRSRRSALAIGADQFVLAGGGAGGQRAAEREHGDERTGASRAVRPKRHEARPRGPICSR
jgi:hypothetical protein